MNRPAFFYSLPFVLLYFLPLFADVNLQDALNKSNQGDSAGAIRDLEELRQKDPRDGKVAQSLGLLYQSTDQDDKAIAELERAISLAPQSHSYFALGLLYEEKWVTTRDVGWKDKAVRAWEDFLRVADPANPHRSAGERHLQKLRNNG